MNKVIFFLKKIKNLLERLGLFMSFLVNSVLLFLVYIFGFGLTFIIAKIFGKKFFKNEILKNEESYWEDLNSKNKNIESYYRQF